MNPSSGEPVLPKETELFEAPVTGSTGLTGRVASGAAWSVVSRVLLQLISFISVAIVARKLTPEMYGLMNMAQIVIGLLAVFRDIGIGSAVIRERELTRDFLSTLFWMSAALGLFVTLLCFGLAPVAAAFYEQPLVGSMLRVLSVSFVITNFTAVHAALLNRQMQIRMLAIVEVSAGLAGLIVAICFAYSSQGVWSLVAAALANAIVSTAGLVAVSRWTPTFQFDWDQVRAISKFGMNLSGFNLINYFGRNADKLFIAKYLGSAPVGYYQFAYTLMLYPVQNISQILGRVLFPAFSEMQDDHARFRSAYLRSVAMIAFISFPIMAGMAAVAQPFVLVWMGPQWAPLVPILNILAPVGALQAIGTTVGHIFMAKGRTDLMFRWALVAIPCQVASFAIGLRWGVTGVAIAYAVVTALLSYPQFRIPFALIDLPVLDLVKTLRPHAITSSLMYTVVYMVRLGMGNASALSTLITCVGAGIVVYGLLAMLFSSAVVEDLKIMVKSLLSQRQVRTAG